jgi:hypothetical protein
VDDQLTSGSLGPLGIKMREPGERTVMTEQKVPGPRIAAVTQVQHNVLR